MSARTVSTKLCEDCPTPDLCVPGAMHCRNQYRWIADAMDQQQRVLDACKKLKPDDVRDTG